MLKLFFGAAIAVPLMLSANLTAASDKLPTTHPLHAILLHPFPPATSVETLHKIIPARKPGASAPLLYLSPPATPQPSDLTWDWPRHYWHRLTYFQALARKPDHVQFNVISNRIIALTFPSDHAEALFGRASYGQALSDAKKLGDVIFTYTEISGTPLDGQSSFTVVHVASGKTEHRVVPFKDGDIAPAISALIETAGSLAGWSHEQMTSAELLSPAISPQAWRGLSDPHGIGADLTYRKLILPETPEVPSVCIAIERGQNWTPKQINKAIDHRPWDDRILFAKAFGIRRDESAMPYSLAIIRAITRLEPESYNNWGALTLFIEELSSSDGRAVEPYEEMVALGEEVEALKDVFGDNYGTHWLASEAWSNLSSVVRGVKVAGETPRHLYELYVLLSQKAYESAYASRKNLGRWAPGPASNAVRYLAMADSAAAERVLKDYYTTNKTDYKPFGTQIYYNSVGWGSQRDFLRLAKRAYGRFKDHPEACMRLLHELAIDLRRAPHFVPSRADKLYEPDRGGPADFTYEVLLQVMDKNTPTSLTKSMAKPLYELALARGNIDLAERIAVRAEDAVLCARIVNHVARQRGDSKNAPDLVLTFSRDRVLSRLRGTNYDHYPYMDFVMHVLFTTGNSHRYIQFVEWASEMEPDSPYHYLNFAKLAHRYNKCLPEALIYAKKAQQFPFVKRTATDLVKKIEERIALIEKSRKKAGKAGAAPPGSQAKTVSMAQ